MTREATVLTSQSKIVKRPTSLKELSTPKIQSTNLNDIKDLSCQSFQGRWPQANQRLVSPSFTALSMIHNPLNDLVETMKSSSPVWENVFDILSTHDDCVGLCNMLNNHENGMEVLDVLTNHDFFTYLTKASEEAMKDKQEVMLMSLINKGDIIGVQHFVKHGVYKSPWACFFAAQEGKTDILVYLIKKGFAHEDIAWALMIRDRHKSMNELICKKMYKPNMDEDGFIAINCGSVLCLMILILHFGSPSSPFCLIKGKTMSLIDLLFYAFMLGKYGCFCTIYKYGVHFLDLNATLSDNVLLRVNKFLTTEKYCPQKLMNIRKAQTACFDYVSQYSQNDLVGTAKILFSMTNWNHLFSSY